MSSRHRGPGPKDRELFCEEAVGRLRSAVSDLSWLLSRGYAPDSTLKLVGDRYALDARQRLAVRRSSCSDQSRCRRIEHEVQDALGGQPLQIDGFNVLVTAEVALSGGLMLVGRDGCIRDLASVHGTWRRVEETERGLILVGEVLESFGVGAVTWRLDRPVSNSGRLAEYMREMGSARGWPWSVELDFDPDAVLRGSDQVVATADGVILDVAGRWLNLGRRVVDRVPGAWVVDLGVGAGVSSGSG